MKWIVANKYPKDGESVLIFDGKNIDIDRHYGKSKYGWESYLKVTHWMPLPDPPKE